MKKSLLKVGTAIFLLILTISGIGYADMVGVSSIEAFGLDTVAGYNTFLKTSPVSAGTSVVFDVEKPDGQVVSLSSVSGGNGVAQVELPGDYTKQAGVYYVSARFKNVLGVKSSFDVFPGNFSKSSSKIFPENQVVSSLGESGVITVQLLDDFLNPITGHLVALVSSSDGDSVELLSSSSSSDSFGKVTFKVSSSLSGAVTYTAYDVTVNEVVDQRAKVAYFSSGDSFFTGNLQSVGAGSKVDHFKFSDVPDAIEVNQSVNATLTAYDITEKVVNDYVGTVKFSVIGDNGFYANLPVDYKFELEDLGKHEFNLAFSFKKDGVYKVEARDLNDIEVFSTYDFVVGGNVTSGQGVSSLKILSPVAGTYSNNKQVISGTSSAGAKLKVFDNNVEIGSVVSDSMGNFSFTTGALIDGSHKIYVATVNEVGTIVNTSSALDIVIDTASPDVSKVVIEPSETLVPGSIGVIKLYVADELAQAAFVFQNNIYELTKNPSGYYESSFVAPSANGEYPISFVLVDQLGNESRLDNKATVTVGNVPGVNSTAVLGDVSGLIARTADRRVTLDWDAPLVALYGIKNYRVYYGLSPNQLTEAVDTFTNSTTWYIPNLKNNVAYYFAVVAVDTKGNVSDRFSNIVSATPNPIALSSVPVDVTKGTAGADALKEMKTDASDSGPEVYWLVVVSLIGGFFYSIGAKRRFCRDVLQK